MVATPKVATAVPASLAPDYNAIADYIYKMESGSGLNDQKCERLGKHNGYGYMQGTNRNFCLSSDNEVRILVIDWLKNNYNGNLKETLCRYNTGEWINNCDYIKTVSQLKTLSRL